MRGTFLESRPGPLIARCQKASDENELNLQAIEKQRLIWEGKWFPQNWSSLGRARQRLKARRFHPIGVGWCGVGGFKFFWCRLSFRSVTAANEWTWLCYGWTAPVSAGHWYRQRSYTSLFYTAEGELLYKQKTFYTRLSENRNLILALTPPKIRPALGERERERNKLLVGLETQDKRLKITREWLG